MSAAPSLDELLRNGSPLRPSRPNAPDIWICQWQEQPLLLKSYHHTSALYRQTVGRWAIEREWWALGRLSETGRAPLPRFRLAPWSVAVEYIEGTALENLRPGQVAADHLLLEARGLLSDLATHGVVHGDIGHDFWSVQGRESNLILSSGQRLIAIDFAGSWRLAHGRLPWRRISQALRLHDELLTTKILYHLSGPEQLSHPDWRLPSQRSLAWWNLMRTLGKL